MKKWNMIINVAGFEDALESSTKAAIDGSGADPAEAVAGVRKSFGL